MRQLLRHLLAIAALPFTVTVLVPLWIARCSGGRGHPVTGPFELFGALAGFLLLCVGLALFVASLRRFATEGHGTLAPWDPPRELVLRGPYRYVRNPMISGIVFVLVGEASILRSLPQGLWAGLSLVLNLGYIPWIEEPRPGASLRRRLP